VVNLKPQPLDPPGRNPGTLLIGGWEGLRVGLEVLKKKKILF